MAFRLFDHNRGSVVAPAGCGKTQAIVDALVEHAGPAALILTHTNAGVAALKGRLAKAKVPSQAFRLSTIDGWSMRLVAKFPGLSSAPALSGKVNYPAIRQAALRLVASGAIDEPMRATYSRLVVDEYQDCSRDQHAIILKLAEQLKTCVLGDPLQRIFDFRSTDHPDWDDDVEGAFGRVGEFDTPWRWLNAGQGMFGDWVLSVRPALLSGGAIDLRQAPDNVAWVQLPTDPAAVHLAHAQAVNSVRTAAGQGLLVLGDSKNPRSRADFARKMPGLNVVEPVDLTDLVAAADMIDNATGIDRLRATLEFAALVMTEIDIDAMGKRLTSLSKGTARNPADDVEAACLQFADDDGFAVVSDGDRHRTTFQSRTALRQSYAR